VLEILTYLNTLRFLRAGRVQTGCDNYTWWDRLFIFQNAHTKKASTGRLSGAVFRFSSHALASWIQVLK